MDAPARGESDYYAVGIRVRPGELVGVLVDLDGKSVPLRPRGPRSDSATRELADARPETVVAGVAAMVEQLLSLRSDLRDRVIGLGVVVGGHIHDDTGEIHFSPSFGWRDVPLGRLLAEATNLDVVIHHDAKARALAAQFFEQHGEHGTFAVVKVGAGVGCALVINHELYTGHTGLAGEFGHFVLDPWGSRCVCGHRGCLQTFASRDAMLRVAREEQLEVTSIDELAALARSGDRTAAAVLADAGAVLGRGLSMLLNLLNLPLLLLYAEEPLLWTDLWLSSVRDAVEQHAFSSAATDCEIVVYPVSDELEARGVASMALARLSELPGRRD